VNISRSARIALAAIALTIAVQPMAAQKQTPVSVPKTVLEKYAGEYQLNPQVTAVVRVKGDQLIREIMGQQQVFIPISETRFKLGGGEVEFVIDEAGGVTMVVGKGPDEKRYPRKPKR
jgi:hypothetical protein